VNAADGYGRTALHEAAFLGHAPVVELLLARGARPNTPIYHYIEVGPPPFVAPGKPSTPVKVHRVIGSVDTPLTLAVDQANADVVAILLRHGADLTRQGNRDALARLMRNVGAPIRRPLRKDISTIPKGDAADEAGERIYDMLVARTDLHRSGGPALLAAVDRGQWGYARDLIERGAPVNARDQTGQTVLMLTVEAIGVNRDQADPTQMAKDGLSPEEIRPLVPERRAAVTEGMNFLRFLLRRHPDINASGPCEPVLGPD
jgi:ankyrin repeat protein